jgi:hypothetical protein
LQRKALLEGERLCKRKRKTGKVSSRLLAIAANWGDRVGGVGGRIHIKDMGQVTEDGTQVMTVTFSISEVEPTVFTFTVKVEGKQHLWNLKHPLKMEGGSST